MCSNDFHIKKESYKNNIFETVASNPFDGITSAPVAGGAAAGHDPFGIQNLKAPKSDTLPEPPKMPEVADASPNNNEPSAAGGEGHGGEGVFAVPAALEATVLPKDEIAEEKAEEAVPRNAEEKAEHERNKKEEPKTQEEKKEEKKVEEEKVEEKKVEEKKEDKKAEVVAPVAEEVKKADLPVVVIDEEKKKE